MDVEAGGSPAYAVTHSWVAFAFCVEWAGTSRDTWAKWWETPTRPGQDVFARGSMSLSSSANRM